jgi:hypothetical protein
MFWNSKNTPNVLKILCPFLRHSNKLRHFQAWVEWLSNTFLSNMETVLKRIIAFSHIFKVEKNCNLGWKGIHSTWKTSKEFFYEIWISLALMGILKTSKDFSKMLSWVHYQVNNDLMSDDTSSMTHMVKSRYVESKKFYSLKNGDWISLDRSNQLDVILAIGIF